jgi:hypothetical protein
VSSNGVVIDSNIINKSDTAAIGIFANCTNAIVSNNIIIDPMQDSIIRFCGIEIGSANNVSVLNNTITDTNSPSNTDFGILLKSNCTNTKIFGNNISNVLTSRFGYYVVDPFAGQVQPFTSPSQVSSSTLIYDTQEGSKQSKFYSDTYVVTSSSSSAFSVSQEGSGNRLEINKPGDNLSEFVVDNNGRVGLNILPSLFSANVTVASSGTVDPIVSILQYSDSSSGCNLVLGKTRATNPYLNAPVQNGDELGAIRGRGDYGAGYADFAVIQLLADGAATASSRPSRIAFYTTASGTTSPSQRLSIKESGSINFTPSLQPSGVVGAGDVYFDAGTTKLRCFDGSVWNDLF